MITIYEIDNFFYRENHDVFLQYRILFKDIGLTPYYPYESVALGRAKPVEEELRIGFLQDNDKRKIVSYNPMPFKELKRAINEDYKKLLAHKR